MSRCEDMYMEVWLVLSSECSAVQYCDISITLKRCGGCMCKPPTCPFLRWHQKRKRKKKIQAYASLVLSTTKEGFNWKFYVHFYNTVHLPRAFSNLSILTLADCWTALSLKEACKIVQSSWTVAPRSSKRSGVTHLLDTPPPSPPHANAALLSSSGAANWYISQIL